MLLAFRKLIPDNFHRAGFVAEKAVEDRVGEDLFHGIWLAVDSVTLTKDDNSEAHQNYCCPINFFRYRKKFCRTAVTISRCT